jgi:hypothetical protein
MDLFTVLPFDSLQLMGALPTDGACGDSTGMLLKAVRIVRVARLLKLLRVLRASRIVTRWQSQLNLSSTTQSLFTAWFAFIILVHWLACLWALMPQLQTGPVQQHARVPLSASRLPQTHGILNAFRVPVCEFTRTEVEKWWITPSLLRRSLRRCCATAAARTTLRGPRD